MDVHERSVPIDVAVVGAGAAGLAAARTLVQRGADVLVLEARERIGGRAYTLRSQRGDVPVELGAEFIHGSARSTMELLRECGRGTLPIGEGPDLWQATQRVLEGVDLRGPDRSVDSFLRDLGTQEARQARRLIEGFDAAVTADASLLAIAAEWRGETNDTQARPEGGYGALMQHLADRCTGRIVCGAPVREIRWSRSGVELFALRDGRPVEMRARRAVVTLPAGVLRERAVRFVPPLPPEKERALEAIAMGPVVKVLLEFRSVFWEEAFFQAPPRGGFGTVWSRMPQRAPLLAVWAGGDAARRVCAQHADPVAAAVETCEDLFSHVRVREQLVAAQYHDWQRDACARGAYSYLRVGAGDARERLARPVDEVLFFAGEAACAADAGTVAGALESGRRAGLAVF